MNKKFKRTAFIWNRFQCVTIFSLQNKSINLLLER